MRSPAPAYLVVRKHQVSFVSCLFQEELQEPLTAIICTSEAQIKKMTIEKVISYMKKF